MEILKPFVWISDQWMKLSEEKRKKIVYEVGSVFNTFIAAFLIQMAVDIQAAHFVISLNTAAIVSIILAAFRAGIKAVLQLFVAFVRERFGNV